MEDKRICSVCGKEENKYDMVKLNGEWYCVDCLNESYFFCEEHYDYEPISEMVEVETEERGYITICKEAFEENYRYCDECGRLIRRSNAYDWNDSYLCASCYEDKKVIRSYHNSHNKERKFFGNPLNGIYFGLEIESEIDDYEERTRNERAYNVKQEIEEAFEEDFLFFEEDGSLDDGFETITQPMSYEFITNNDVVEKITNSLCEQGMEATDNCGLHIHITRTEEVEDKIGKILAFFENNKEELIEFSRRDEDNFFEWCDFYTSCGDAKLTALEAERICLYPRGRRHMCINLTNENTIEFRCFAGTLNSKIIYGCIEFILTLLERIDDIKDFEDLRRINKFDNLRCLLI